MPKEKTIRSNIQKYIISVGGYCIPTTGVCIAGTPDIIACVNGQMYALEVKQPDRRNQARGGATPVQVNQLRRWKQAGAIVAVVYGVEDVRGLIDEQA